MSYVVTDLAGNEVKPGDKVVGGLGQEGIFEKVEYGPEFTGTARVRVSGFESVPTIWGLIVTVKREGVGCPL